MVYLLHHDYTHLDRPGGATRIMFFDFSFAFNTIKPALLGKKMIATRMFFLPYYLTGHPQYVRVENCVSDAVVSSTGVPQRTVLSPFLFTLCTSDLRYDMETCHLQNFSDDSAVVGCIRRRDVAEYQWWTFLWSGVN